MHQPNHFAAYLAAALASAAYLYGRGRFTGRFVAVCMMLLTLLVALSGSRSPWLYLALFAVLAAAAHRQQRDGGSRRLAVFTFWLLAAFLAAQWVARLPWLQPEEGMVLTSAQRLFENASGIESRVQLAHEAWLMFLDAP